jgi:hypothetical protein
MFLVLNQQLKEAHLTTGLFQKLPPARELVSVVRRLLVLGVGVLTLGVFCGVMMEIRGDGIGMAGASGVGRHLLIAMGLWVSYGVLLVVTWWRGLPPRMLSLASIVLFVFSLLLFLVI